MEKRQWKDSFSAYVWQYRYTIVLFFIDTGVFAFLFHLYNLETEAVLYASGLCILITIIVLSATFIFYRKRHLEYQRILNHIEIM